MKFWRLLFQTDDALAPVVMRCVLALVMFPHGAQKVLGWFGGVGFKLTLEMFTQQMHIPLGFALLAMAAEFLGPMALLPGLLTRVAAFAIGVDITVAALMVHIHNGFFMNWTGHQVGEGFEYHLLMAGLALALVIQGGGRWALDARIARRLGR